ncbi:hypothetical protein [Streptomyces sp. NPDC003832]
MRDTGQVSRERRKDQEKVATPGTGERGCLAHRVSDEWALRPALFENDSNMT